MTNPKRTRTVVQYLAAVAVGALISSIVWGVTTEETVTAQSGVSATLPLNTGVDYLDGAGAPPIEADVMDASGTIFFGPDLKATTTDPKKGRTLEVVVDAGCHYCSQFETANADGIKQWVKDGNTLKLTMIPMLDREAVPAVIDFPIILSYLVKSDPDKVFDIYQDYYKNWATDSGNMKPWTVADYNKLLKDHGVSDSNIQKAILATGSPEWVTKTDGFLTATTDRIGANFVGTPYVTLDGKKLPEDLYYMAEGSMASYLSTGKIEDQYSITYLQEQAEKNTAQSGQ